jgi:hypothetical protein
MALTQQGDESITVSSTAIGFTAAEIPPTKGHVIKADIYVESGGPVRWNSSQDPTAGGSEGSPLVYAKSVIEVVGSLGTFRMIKDTGVSDATVRVVYLGSASH